jgi:hypothetical protein
MTMTVATLASALGLLVVIGCGDDGLGKRYPVSGKVTYKSEPVAIGTVTFFATSGKDAETHGATGAIKDGYYSMSTIGGEDGVFPGDYQVSIAARKADMSQAKANQEKTGGSFRQDDVAKAYKNAESLIPKKYESTEKSGLKAKVEAHSNTINFDLTD